MSTLPAIRHRSDRHSDSSLASHPLIGDAFVRQFENGDSKCHSWSRDPKQEDAAQRARDGAPLEFAAAPPKTPLKPRAPLSRSRYCSLHALPESVSRAVRAQATGLAPITSLHHEKKKTFLHLHTAAFGFSKKIIGVPSVSPSFIIDTANLVGSCKNPKKVEASNHLVPLWGFFFWFASGPPRKSPHAAATQPVSLLQLARGK
ncbi:hypothetical protein V8E53_012197 [Lactarius tabidus]